MFKAALTHDVDRVEKTYQYITHSINAFRHNGLEQLSYNLKNIKNWKNEYWNFDRIMEIEEEFKVRSTFYFLNEPIRFNVFDWDNWIHSVGRYSITGERIAEIIRTLDRSGWEVGMHGSYNSYKDLCRMQKEKEILESILGKKVEGIRQHYLNLNANITWKFHSEIGFLYDSSWGPKKEIGFKEGKVKPFYPLGNKFIVYPLSIMDYCFMAEKERWNKFNQICREIELNDGILVINWHNCAFNKNDYPGSEDAYIEIIKRCIDKGAVFKKLIEFTKMKY